MISIAQPRPKGTVRLDEFCNNTVLAWIDGRAVETNRVEIQFPNKDEELQAVARLVKSAVLDRDTAVKFLLDVLDVF